jgi:hypothetical protein
MRGMLLQRQRAALAALALVAGVRITAEVVWWLRGTEEDRLGLDIKNLEGETRTTTIKVAGGEFDVTYHPHVATRSWQTKFANLQRDQQDVAADQDLTEDERQNDLDAIADEITEQLGALIEGWDLEYDGDPVPVSALGMDMLSMPAQQALFQGLLSDASGGSEEEKKPKKRRSRRGSS